MHTGARYAWEELDGVGAGRELMTSLGWEGVGNGTEGRNWTALEGGCANVSEFLAKPLFDRENSPKVESKVSVK